MLSLSPCVRLCARVSTLIVAILWLSTSPASAAKLTALYAGPITAASACNPDGVGATPVVTAGAVTDYCFAFRTERVSPTGDHLKGTVIDSPPGVIANTDGAPQCPVADFGAKSATTAARCSADTQVGEASSNIRVLLAPGIELPQTITGKVFNLTHTNNEGGLLGVELVPNLLGISLPRTKLLLPFLLRPAPDVGLRSPSDNYPQVADTGLLGVKPIAVDGFTFRFWGSRNDHPSMGASFVRLGSSCGPQSITISATSYAGQRSALTRTYDATGCDQLRLEHAMRVSVDDPRPDVPAETRLTLTFAPPANPDVTTNASAGSARVLLPRGLTIGAQVATGEGGLPLCTEAQFALDDNALPQCPAASAIGTVTFVSTYSKIPYTGTVYLGPQAGPSRLPQLYLAADTGGTAADAPRIKVTGTQAVDETGTLVTELTGLPDFPFSTMELVLRGGRHGVLTTPPECGTTTGTSAFAGTSPDTPVSTAPVSLTIDQDCAPQVPAPSLDVAMTSQQAGASGNPSFTLTRPDRSPRLRRAVVHLPVGVLASLKGVTECAPAQIAALACPESSRVGSVSSVSGVGPAPLSAPTGGVYLSPRPQGAVAAITVISPAAFGGIDLGAVVATGRIDLRPGDLGLDLSIDVPTALRDVPLALRSMTVTLDRPGFSRNPTACGTQVVTAELSATSGAVTEASAPVATSGCEALPFAPEVMAGMPAGLKVGDAPGMTITVRQASGQAALKRVAVTLPTGFAADLSRLGRACSQDDFRTGACGAAATIGTIQGAIGILDEPIGGRLVVVKVPRATLPGIGLELEGRFSARLLGRSSVIKSGQLAVVLDDLPDAPIEALTMTLQPGAQSVLKLASTYCASGAATFSFAMTGQNGASAERSVTTPCGKAPLSELAAPSLSARLRGARGTAPRLALRIGSDPAARLVSVRVTLPTGLRFRRGGRIAVIGGTALSRRGQMLRVALKPAGEQGTTITTGPGALYVAPKVVARRRAGAATVLLRYASGVTQQRRVPIAIR